jgi:rhamnosyltransferase
MLIAREVFEKVGLFREEFFIDCVDTDYFLRAAANGYATVAAMDCSIAHELGRRASTIPGRPGIAVHPPFRRYYMARNRFVLIHEYGHRNRVWLRHTLRTEGVGFLLALLRGSLRRQQVVAVVEGYKAFRGASLGPIPPDVAARLTP